MAKFTWVTDDDHILKAKKFALEHGKTAAWVLEYSLDKFIDEFEKKAEKSRCKRQPKDEK